MRFRQLLILIVLLAMALLVSAQSGPNFSATRTALAQQTQIRQGTRVFLTPAEFQLTVSAQALDGTNAARTATPPTAIPSVEVQIIATEVFPSATPSPSTPVFGDSVLPMALLFFGGVLLALGVLGGILYALNRNEQNNGRPRGGSPFRN